MIKGFKQIISTRPAYGKRVSDADLSLASESSDPVEEPVVKKTDDVKKTDVKKKEDKEKVAFSELRRTRRGTPEYEEKRLELAAIRKELILTERALNQVADRFERDADKARRIWRKKVRSNKVRRLKSGPPPNMREAQEAASQTQGLMPTAPIQ